jgi:hypothetical protein
MAVFRNTVKFFEVTRSTLVVSSDSPENVATFDFIIDLSTPEKSEFI